MIITKETDYALRILRALLDGQKHTAVSIAAGEMVPQTFAYQILRKLNRAGLIRVLRGQDGGCELNCDLSATTLYDVMSAVEDKGRIAPCTREGYTCPWRQENGECHIHNRLCAIQDKLDDALRAVNLRELLTGENASS